MSEILTGQPAHTQEGKEGGEGHVEETQNETSEETGHEENS